MISKLTLKIMFSRGVRRRLSRPAKKFATAGFERDGLVWTKTVSCDLSAAVQRLGMCKDRWERVFVYDRVLELLSS